MKARKRRECIFGALLFLSASLVASPPTFCQVAFGSFDVTLDWDVTHNSGSGLFEYRYTLTNTSGSGRTFRLSLAETTVGAHAGAHHESNFLTAGGAFGYDVFIVGFDSHNTTWSSVFIPGGGQAILGFDDPHGPRAVGWHLDVSGNSGEFFTPGLPAPVSSTNSTHAGAAVLDEARIVTPTGDVKAWGPAGSFATKIAGGWHYRWFLRNTGNITIGPEGAGVTTNQGDYWIRETPRHAGIHHETFPGFPSDNANAVSFGPETTPIVTPPFAGSGIGNHFSHWSRIGDGLGGPWDPGQVLELEAFDPHGPTFSNHAGRVVRNPNVSPGGPGTIATFAGTAEFQMVEVPDVPVIGPSVPAMGTLWYLVLALLLAAGATRVLRRGSGHFAVGRALD